MAEVGIGDALEKIKSDKQKDRVEGISDLRRIFQTTHHASKLHSLNDKAYQRIFEALFAYIRVERSAFLKSVRNASRSQSGTRLSNGASTLRTVLEFSVRKLRLKSLHAIIEHITEALPVSEGGFCDHLKDDYPKCLRILLAFPPHVEHLDPNRWQQLVDFCLEGISASDPAAESQLSFRGSTRRSATPDGGSVRSTPVRTFDRQLHRSFQQGNKDFADELVLCIQHLVSASCVPILSRAESLLEGLTDFLAASHAISRSHQAAFVALNVLLEKVITDQVDIVHIFVTRIAPIIRRLWSSKSSALRDQMLITLLWGLQTFKVDLGQSEEDKDTVAVLEMLHDILRQEYCSRQDRDLLQFDDLDLGVQDQTEDVFKQALLPRSDASKSEQNWALVNVVGRIVMICQSLSKPVIKDDDETTAHSKRLKRSSHLDDLFRLMSSPNANDRIFALQVITFLAGKDLMSHQLVAEDIHLLTGHVNDDNSEVATWSMLAISRLSLLETASMRSIDLNWQSVWQIAIRHLNNISTARAASYLVSAIVNTSLLPPGDILASIASVLGAVESTGPYFLTDSSLLFWKSITQFAESSGSNLLDSVNKGAIQWIRAIWASESLHDRAQVSQMANHSRPLDVLGFLATAAGKAYSTSARRANRVCGPIIRSWLRYQHNASLIDYLVNATVSAKTIPPAKQFPGPACAAQTNQGSRQDRLILELLQHRLENLLATWHSLTDADTGHVSVDSIYIITSYCFLAQSFSGLAEESQPIKSKELGALGHSLWARICAYLEHQPNQFYDASLKAVSYFISCVSFHSTSDAIANGAACIIGPLLELQKKKDFTDATISKNEEDFMDLDDSPVIATINTADGATDLSSREENVYHYDTKAFKTAVLTEMVLLFGSKSPSGDRKSLRTDASVIVEHLQRLRPADLLVSRVSIVEAIRAADITDRDLATELLTFVGETCLQTYDLERCEVSQCFCIDIMMALSSLWATDDDDELHECAADIYVWFVNVGLKKNMISPRSLISVADLLHCLLEFSPSWVMEESGISPRTHLFQVLETGTLPVKYHIAMKIDTIFERFILGEHIAIFNDILTKLPRDPDWIEGIALRLFVLARLASRWHTLLRQSIYHIFETPGNVPESAPYAKSCIEDISRTLRLQDCKTLFKLFVSQILYTWLESGSIYSIPFGIFGYESLLDLLRDVQDDIVGQIAMRGSDEEAVMLQEIFGTDFDSLLKESFSKAEAYSLARDISVPPSQEDSQSTSAESWIRKRLGKEEFLRQIEHKFPQIVAMLFKAIDQEEQFEKALSKGPNELRSTLKSYQSIPKSSSQISLLSNQQPSFRAKYLLKQLEFLCKRSPYSLDHMWTPALLVYVARTLLDLILPALGSLHTCSVIRKLKILITLAGPLAFEDYPLEMLLQGLRPHLSNVNCSEDAIGVFQYLVTGATHHLSTHPTFFLEISISSFATLRELLSSSQDSTTQESHFKATLSRAQEFHEWLSQFLKNVKPLGLPSESEETFGRILECTLKSQLSANASKGTYEGELMLQLLQDQSSGRKLLSGPAFESVMELISVNFETPEDHENDILGEDDICVSNASTLWTCLQNGTSTPDFKLWAARALGRSFASTGRIQADVLREHANGQSTMSYQSSSEMQILRALYSLIGRQGSSHDGLVEDCLRPIRAGLAATPEEMESLLIALPEPTWRMLDWSPYICPDFRLSSKLSKAPLIDFSYSIKAGREQWAQQMAMALALSKTGQANPVIAVLPRLLKAVPALAVTLLPSILHVVLLGGIENGADVRTEIGESFNEALEDTSDEAMEKIRLVIECLLNLRGYPIPNEKVPAERDRWLEIDYSTASQAALRCRLFKTALLFTEIHCSQLNRTSRRSAVSRNNEPSLDSLHQIFVNIDDPDSFYGVQHDTSVGSVMEKLEFESSGFKSLAFQSANLDSTIRQASISGATDFAPVMQALGSANLYGISSAVNHFALQNGSSIRSTDESLRTSMHLMQWDIAVASPESTSFSSLFGVFQSLNTASSIDQITETLNNSFSRIIDGLIGDKQTVHSARASWRALGILAETDEILSCKDLTALEATLARHTTKKAWLESPRLSDVQEILSCREALFWPIASRSLIRSALNIGAVSAQLLQIKALRESFKASRSLGALQSGLSTAVTTSKLVDQCSQLGLDISAVAQYDIASILWQHDEMGASIQILKSLSSSVDLEKQAIPVSRSSVLVKAGRYISEARLEKPEVILQDYLIPAIKSLGKVTDGHEAEKVFHEFASFCDQQLQTPDILEDFRRIEKIRHRKQQEVDALQKMMKDASTQKEKDTLKSHWHKAKQWFDLDDREYQRLKHSRESFLRQSLENYLLSLRAGDSYNNDALRFCALWLDESGNPVANEAVAKYLSLVPSRKFAPLMNQLSSRLLDRGDSFQKSLYSLVYRICCDHPYHGMYQIFASSKSKGGRDETALARHSAANKLVEKLRNDRTSGPTWVAIHNTNITYIRFATTPLGEKMRSGSKVELSKLEFGKRLLQDAKTSKLPPPTMSIELRIDCDYSDVPHLVSYQSHFSVASGVSAPKIVTAIASDGNKYKQLFKGGNDDLRQDAIMEQVFEQVSDLLRAHRSTRQRNLGIRTYKVLPLTANAGIIEFVPSTIPLHDYLMPAHQRHFPRDMKPNACRKNIADAQGRSADHRVKIFKQICDHFHPVMRYFFMERFPSPDGWFAKRLAYSRSTAAISILGHILGLGDRHGHNILLDETTGEVVHIDLGVAFEQGRVLPVPEVVPFRLTRDLVDGFGVTGTEGVFRRCCEFTLEALRQDAHTIMIILDVLRYDPLYSWSVSPLRMKRMQEEQAANVDAAAATDANGGAVEAGNGDWDTRKKDLNEPSEADRALTVVKKKLGKALSVTAAVNELIQQATDGRNLAVLYCGWAAYA